MILLTDFNAKWKSFSVNNTKTEEATVLGNLTSLYEMKQLISAPTHTLQNSSSCIDLTFVNHLNLLTDSGIHP